MSIGATRCDRMRSTRSHRPSSAERYPARGAVASAYAGHHQAKMAATINA
jgi:hypothetical protein